MKQHATCDPLAASREFFEGYKGDLEALAMAHLRPTITETFAAIVSLIPPDCSHAFATSAYYHLVIGDVTNAEREHLVKLIDQILPVVKADEISDPYTLVDIFEFMTGVLELNILKNESRPYVQQVLTAMNSYIKGESRIGIVFGRPATRQATIIFPANDKLQ